MAQTLARPNLKGEIAEDAPSPIDYAPQKINDYGAKIAELRLQLERRETRRNLSANENELARLNSDIMQLLNAIELYEQAEFIPVAMTQFGTHMAKEWSFNLPPKMAGWNRNTMKVQARNYVFRTDDPFKIAACRSVLKAGQIEGLQEMEPGLSAAITPTGRLFRWLPARDYIDWMESGSARTY